jgi:predicted ATPase
MAMAGPTDRPFVGRVAEREALAAQIAAAQGAGGRVVLVVGEPGVGKTRLIEEAVATVAAGRVLWGRCQDIQGAPAFWPWIQALRSYARTVSPEQLRVEAGDDAAHLARIMPGVRWRAPDVDAQTEETLDPEAARFRLFDLIAQ